jgi:hypothetical protein
MMKNGKEITNNAVVPVCCVAVRAVCVCVFFLLKKTQFASSCCGFPFLFGGVVSNCPTRALCAWLGLSELVISSLLLFLLLLL